MDLSRRVSADPGSLLPGGPGRPAAVQPQGAGQPDHLGHGHRHRLPLVQLLPACVPPQHLGAGPQPPALSVLLPRNIQRDGVSVLLSVAIDRKHYYLQILHAKPQEEYLGLQQETELYKNHQRHRI